MAEWIDRVLTILAGDGAQLVLVDGARDAHLKTLFEAVRAQVPSVDVVLDAKDVFRAPEGATLIYLPDVAEAAVLNAGRPILAAKGLRVLLWCDDDTAAKLALGAPDFFDWIAHRVACPDAPTPWAVDTLRCAMTYEDVPGLIWALDEDPVRAIEAAGGAVRRRVSVRDTPEAMVRAAREAEGDWVWFTDVTDARMMDVRWACAEAGRSARTLVTPAPGEATDAWADVVNLGGGIVECGWWYVVGLRRSLRERMRELAHSHWVGFETWSEEISPREVARLGDEPIIDSLEDWWERGAVIHEVLLGDADPVNLMVRRMRQNWQRVVGVGPSPARPPSRWLSALFRTTWRERDAQQSRLAESSRCAQIVERGLSTDWKGWTLRAWASTAAAFRIHVEASRHTVPSNSTAPWHAAEALLRGRGADALRDVAFWSHVAGADPRWRAHWGSSIEGVCDAAEAERLFAEAQRLWSVDRFTDARRALEGAAGVVDALEHDDEPTALNRGIAAWMLRADLASGMDQPTLATAYRVHRANLRADHPEHVRWAVYRGESARAAAMLFGATNDETTHAPVYILARSELWFALGEDDQIVAELETAIATPSQDQQLMQLLAARVLARQGRFDEAQRRLDALSSRLTACIVFARWELHHRRLDFRAVIEHLDETLRAVAGPLGDAHPLVGEVHLIAGEAHFSLGQYPLAAASFARAVTILSSRLGDAHPTTLRARLWQALERRRAEPDAIAHQRDIDRVAAHVRARLGSSHPEARRLLVLAAAPHLATRSS